MAARRKTSLPNIPLDLAPDPALTFETFLLAPSNADALSVIQAWPHWPAPALLLLGPEGSGKTHLGEAWLKTSHGIFLDDAHHYSEDELFGFINKSLRGDIPGLLLASRIPPSGWGISLPDLNSRLNAMPVLRLEDPDDDSLRPITRTLFEQRGRVVPEDVIDYLLDYTDRSVPSLRRTVATIDDAAREAKADVTKRFTSVLLRASGDLFEG